MVRVHINNSQKDQLEVLVAKTGIDVTTLLDEALCLFLERWEYVTRQDPYFRDSETKHYQTISAHDCTVTIDLTRSPGIAIAEFLAESFQLNAISLSYVTRKALALLFEGTPAQKRLHV